MSVSSNRKTVVSLFSGVGGLDLGFHGGFKIPREYVGKSEKNHILIKPASRARYVELRRTNFDILFANDIKPEAKVAWTNYFSKYGIDPSIYKVGSIVDLVKQHNEEGNIFPPKADVVIGGFPCQDFSLAGKRQGFKSNKSHSGQLMGNYSKPNIENRGSLYIWMREVINIIRPKVFIAENVKGLISLTGAKKTIENDFSSADDDGYLIYPPQVLHAGRYGVPQSRERIFFIGLRKDCMKKKALKRIEVGEFIPDEFNPYPLPTHLLDSDLPVNGAANFVAAGQALKGLVEPHKEKKDLSQMWYSRARYYGKNLQGQSEINVEGLAPTIRAEHHGNIEFRRLSKKNRGKNITELEKGLRQRRLTVRECARLQTFPDDYDFVMSESKGHTDNISASAAYRLIGDAVPPLLAYKISNRLDSIWGELFKKK